MLASDHAELRKQLSLRVTKDRTASILSEDWYHKLEKALRFVSEGRDHSV